MRLEKTCRPVVRRACAFLSGVRGAAIGCAVGVRLWRDLGTLHKFYGGHRMIAIMKSMICAVSEGSRNGENAYDHAPDR